MYSLQKMIRRYMYRITGALIAVILIIVLYVELTSERRLAYESSIRTFSQMKQVLAENQKELVEIRDEYKQTCLHNAETISRIIESDPDVLDSVKELKKIATSVEVDEIHIFDTTGRIFTGTHPQYYNFTFDSGEQIAYFKPMLKDKTLKLVQDITPNTAEQKPMQYSALWSKNGKFIVQVGMEPVNVIKVTEKNELSHIFSLFRVNQDVSYYAINASNGEIAGSTDTKSVGCHLAEIGLNFDDLTGTNTGFYKKVNGQYSFCVFQKIGSNYIGRVIPIRNLFRRLPATMLILFICLIIIALILANSVIRYMNRYVVNEIHNVNKKLKAISNRKLDETLNIQSSIEFAKLSEYINVMVKSLLDNNKKMSYVLSKTNLFIGVYEYNKSSEKIYFTEYIPTILSLDAEKMEQLSSDIRSFRKFIDHIRNYPVPDEQGVYKIGEKYVRLEEIRNNDECFGVAVDVTSEFMKLRKIEAERDIDLLTGLYNRRGLNSQLDGLFRTPEKLGYSVIIMIDADGLKIINDTYGHKMGDAYLTNISKRIHSFGTKKSIASRQGGDEFVLFLYGYGSEEELKQDIEVLTHIQNHSSAQLSENLEVPLRFSFGYCLTNGNTEYQKLLKEADDRMYQNKLERKKNMSL